MSPGKIRPVPTTMAALFALSLAGGCVSTVEGDSITAEIWADNWFEMFVDGQKVLEDSTPITTERSFNAESIELPLTLPMTVAFKVMDFKENDSGLEYIGTDRQQMGDGGLIAQFRDTGSGRLIGATNSTVRCLVVHRAPVERSCAKEANPVAGEGACGFVEAAIPPNWTAPGFDDSNWPLAVEHSEADVRPKDGYDEINWDPAARLIWSDNLVQDNTLLCRMTIQPAQ